MPEYIILWLRWLIAKYTLHKSTHTLYTISGNNIGKALLALLTVPKFPPFVLILIKKGQSGLKGIN